MITFTIFQFRNIYKFKTISKKLDTRVRIDLLSQTTKPKLFPTHMYLSCTKRYNLSQLTTTIVRSNSRKNKRKFKYLIEDSHHLEDKISLWKQSSGKVFSTSLTITIYIHIYRYILEYLFSTRRRRKIVLGFPRSTYRCLTSELLDGRRMNADDAKFLFPL